MSINEGTIDRWLRVALGLALLALTVWGPRTAWGYLGVLPLLTGLVGYCPAYSIFGWSSSKSKRARTPTTV